MYSFPLLNAEKEQVKLIRINDRQRGAEMEDLIVQVPVNLGSEKKRNNRLRNVHAHQQKVNGVADKIMIFVSKSAIGYHTLTPAKMH